jgi:hypothetical protein
MLDEDWLADDLIRGSFSPVSQRWLSTHVPGLEIGRMPSADSCRYRQIPATLDYWNSLPKVDGVADTMVVDPLALVPALGSLMLLDVLEQGRDFHYRLYGSRIAQVSGFDMTGKSLNDLPTESPIKMFFRAGYLGVVRHRMPLFTVHKAPETIMIGNWHRLQLPLGLDGEVQRILVCNVGTRPDGEEK